MQGSVHTFESETGAGSILLDSGKVVPFTGEVFAVSGLRLLRLGQRLSVAVQGDPEQEGASVERLWLTGVGPGQPTS